MERACEKYGVRSDFQLRQWAKVHNAHEDFDSVKFSEGGKLHEAGGKPHWMSAFKLSGSVLSAGGTAERRL